MGYYTRKIFSEGVPEGIPVTFLKTEYSYNSGTKTVKMAPPKECFNEQYLKSQQWKEIDFNSDYEVSSLGFVRSKNRVLTTLKEGKSISYVIDGKNLTPILSKRFGYFSVRICDKLKKVHRLVAKAFIPNPHNYPQVNHKNGNKIDNRVDNLEWCSPKENVSHAIKTGLMNVEGVNHGEAKLTEEDVIDILCFYVPGKISFKMLARRYKCTIRVVCNVVYGVSYLGIPRNTLYTPKIISTSRPQAVKRLSEIEVKPVVIVD